MPKRSGKRLCSRGKSCGETCINRGLVCRVELGKPLQSSLKRTSDIIGSSSTNPSTIRATPRNSGESAQDLALKIREKRLKKEDYSQEWHRLLRKIETLSGDEKRDATIKANAAIGKRLKVKVDHKSESKEASQKAGKKFLSKFKGLERTVELINRYDELFNRIAKTLNANTPPDQVARISSKLSEINAKKNQLENRLVRIMGEARGKLLQTTLTDKQVNDLVSRVWTPNASGETKANMTEFIRMFNGRGFTDLDRPEGAKPVRSVSDIPDRAHARPSKGSVKTNPSKSTTFHEIAHIVEAQRPWMSQYAVQWRNGKAYDNISDISRSLERNVPSQGFYRPSMGIAAPLIRLRDMFPGSNYDENEVGIVDRFYSKYMGKVYRVPPGSRERITEVWSMAFEHFSSPQSMAVFYRHHPELFEIVTGLAVSP